MRERKRGHSIWTWRMMAVLSALLFFSTMWILLDYFFQLSEPFHSKRLLIPDFCGLSEDTIEPGEGIVLRSEYRYDDLIEAGVVISQSPRAWSIRRLNASTPACEVTLTVSLGKAREALPQLVGTDAREALVLLRERGIVVRMRIEEGREPAGHVLSQSLPAGTLLSRGEQVTLSVGGGKRYETVTVPSLSGLDRADALLLLSVHGLSLDKVIEVDGDGTAGTVCEQSHPAGIRVLAGSAVTLYISKEGSLGESPFAVDEERLCIKDGEGSSRATVDSLPYGSTLQRRAPSAHRWMAAW